MYKGFWGENNPKIEYRLTCISGPLGGDAQIAVLMCMEMEDLGTLMFFIDPMLGHPHQADIDSLTRWANYGDIIVCSNPTSAMSMIHVFKSAPETGKHRMVSAPYYGFVASPTTSYIHPLKILYAIILDPVIFGGTLIARG